MSVAMPDSRANCPGDDDAETGATAAVRAVPVLLPLPLPEPLDYLAPQGGVALDPGSLVRVTLGSRRLIGAVWDGNPAGQLPSGRLKPILEVLPAPPLRPELRRFIDRVAGYTLAAPGMVLRMAISVEPA